MENKVVIGNVAWKKGAKKNKETVVAWILPEVFGLEWFIPGIGFGEFTFKLTDKKMDTLTGVPSGRWFIQNECCDKDFIKRVVCKAIDDAELADPV